MKVTNNFGVVKLNMNGKHRQGEKGEIPARKQRFYSVETEWFFRTREGIEQGPYKDLFAAKEGLKLFLRRCGITRVAS